MRFHKLGYLALNVTDVARSREFYEKVVGLQYCGEGPAGEAFLRCSKDHHNLVLYPAAAPALKRIAWEMQGDAELDGVEQALRASGVEVWEVPAAERAPLHQGRTLRAVEPTTLATLEFYAQIGQFGAPPFQPTVARIQRLGHAVLTTSQYEQTVAFFEGVLGFRMSDQVEGYVSLMRCFPNPYHHSLGIAKDSRCAFHHFNLMVTDIDDIGQAFWRLKNAGVEIVYGPGRHPTSDSIFLYFLDPDGITLEYSFGMEEFPEDSPRKPRIMLPAKESADTWGGPPNRVTRTAIEGAPA